MIGKSHLLDIEESIFLGADGEGGIKKDIANNQDQKEIFILLLILRLTPKLALIPL
jgi:hypothetical protein